MSCGKRWCVGLQGRTGRLPLVTKVFLIRSWSCGAVELGDLLNRTLKLLVTDAM